MSTEHRALQRGPGPRWHGSSGDQSPIPCCQCVRPIQKGQLVLRHCHKDCEGSVKTTTETIMDLLRDWNQFSLATICLVDKQYEGLGLLQGSLEWNKYFVLLERLLRTKFKWI